MPLRALTLTITGVSALLMDRDNISFAEEIVAWTKDSANADAHRAGDDRAPAWGWLGKLHYGHDGLVGIPQSMLAPCIRAAGALIPHPIAKGGKTLKESSQSGIQFVQISHPLLVPTGDGTTWQTIVYDALNQKLRHEEDFAQHEAVAKAYGFVLDARRSKPQYNRSHIRVRPMFGQWRCLCPLTITDDILTNELILRLFTMAGAHKGIGNWRPSVGKAGSYGMFTVEEGIPEDLQEKKKKEDASATGA